MSMIQAFSNPEIEVEQQRGSCLMLTAAGWDRIYVK